jgi:hypothetical protein
MLSAGQPREGKKSSSLSDIYLREIQSWRSTFSSAGWTCRELVDGTFGWTVFCSAQTPLPQDGIKCHISIDPLDFQREIRNVLLCLLDQPFTFKIAATLECLVRLANGLVGITQIGKAITVYCGDFEQAIYLARCLDQVMTNSHAPLIMGEYVLKPQSRVSLRHGSFQSAIFWDEFGRPERQKITEQGSIQRDDISIKGKTNVTLENRNMTLRSFRHLTTNDILSCNGRNLAPIVKIKSYPREVYRAIDIESGEEFIVKRAWTGSFVDALGYGSEKRQRLRREHEILTYLWKKGLRVSRPFGVIEGDEWTMLISGSAKGEPLSQKLKVDAVTVSLALARLLIELHRSNVVHRDIKLGNILWDGRDVTLIDYEIAGFMDEHEAPLLGSRHYTPPEVGLGASPAAAADIYAFGSVLMSLWQGYDVALLPGLPSDEMQSDAQVTRLIMEIVRSCWHEDPASRPSAEEVASILVTLGTVDDTRKLSRSISNPTFDLPEPVSCLARASGAITRQFAAPLSCGIGYRNAHFFSSHMLEGLNIGAAGIILGLVTLDQAAGTEYFAQDVTTAAATLGGSPPPIKSAGLYTGNAGVALALAVVGQRFGRDDLLKAAKRRFALAAREVTEDDLFSGRAGVVVASDILTEITGDTSYLQDVLPVISDLIGRIKPYAGVLGVMASGRLDGVPGCFTGAAHGAAGIAFALAKFATRVGDDNTMRLALMIFQSIVDHAADRQRGAIFRIAGRNDQPAANMTWCHGPLGILWCLLQDKATVSGLPEMIDWCVEIIEHDLGLNNPTYCHGLAGVLETFRLLGAVSSRHKALAHRVQTTTAKQLWMQRQMASHDQWVWGAEEPSIITPDLMVGSLAPATALALWHKQEAFPLISAAWLDHCANRRHAHSVK